MNINMITKTNATNVKNNTIKVLSGACVVIICLSPINDLEYASDFNFVEDNINTEDVIEGSSFFFINNNQSIGIKNKDR